MNIGRIIDSEYGDITELVLQELMSGTMREEVEAARMQRAMARALPERKASDKLGVPVMSVHPAVYWHWVRREGPECWGDKGFRKDLLRDNPELRPRVVKNRDTVSFAGASFSGVRESVKYEL